jgi:hypothetical protein
MAPAVDLGTAGGMEFPPPTDAFPPETVYVHVTPSTVSVAACAGIVLATAASAAPAHRKKLRNVVMGGPFASEWKWRMTGRPVSSSAQYPV